MGMVTLTNILKPNSNSFYKHNWRFS